MMEENERTLSGLMAFRCDAAHQAAVEALARADEWTEHPGFWRARSSRADGVLVAAGLRERDPGAWELLRRWRPALVKLHYALWARFHQHALSQPDAHATVSVNALLHDLGLAAHPHGGFPRTDRERVWQECRLLAALEIELRFTPPGATQASLLAGPLWSFSSVGMGGHSTAFRFGEAMPDGLPRRGGAIGLAPGPWFQDPDWRLGHRRLGRIPRGFLDLHARRDAWPVLIGAHLACVARMSRYRPCAIRAGALLESAGLAEAVRRRSHPGRSQEQLENALDRLCDVGLLGGWSIEGFDASDCDMLDPDAVASHGTCNPYPPGPWTEWALALRWARELEAWGQRLRAGPQGSP